jgi:hypothetical protein
MVDVGDDGDVSQIHVRFVLAAVSAVRKRWRLHGRELFKKSLPKKELARSMMNRALDTVAAQYSQKSLKNNWQSGCFWPFRGFA